VTNAVHDPTGLLQRVLEEQFEVHTGRSMVACLASRERTDARSRPTLRHPAGGVAC